MQPLSHQERPSSIHSWWSDSNPGLQGPWINLHKATKPLLRLMHYRQTVGFIRRNRNCTLSDATLEIYSSYFPWDFVSWSTKAAILSELSDRTASEVDVLKVLHSPVFPYIPEMLGSPDSRVRSSSCRLLGTLASHEGAASAILDLKPCERLVSLMRDKPCSRAIPEVMYALCQIARWSDGAQAIVETDANVLDHVLESLKSPFPNVRQWSCMLVRHLIGHEPTTPAISKVKPCERLVSIMLQEHCGVIQELAYALCPVACWLDGAPAIVETDAKVLDRVLGLLESPSAEIRECTCKLVGRLVVHEAIARAILELEPWVQLVFLLRDVNVNVVSEAMYALSQIAAWSDAGQAILDAKALDHVLALLESLSTKVREWTCKFVGNLSRYECTAPAILDLKLCERLMSFIGKDSPVITRAVFALAQIAVWVGGARAIVRTNALDSLSALFESSNLDVRKWTCMLVGRLADHESTAPAILEVNVCGKLMTLLCEPGTRADASFALSAICKWPGGIAALADIGVFDAGGRRKKKQ